jgi:hypothetical protein
MEVSRDDLLDGFQQAYTRLRDAKNDSDFKQVFFALFETLQ